MSSTSVLYIAIAILMIFVYFKSYKPKNTAKNDQEIKVNQIAEIKEEKQEENVVLTEKIEEVEKIETKQQPKYKVKLLSQRLSTKANKENSVPSAQYTIKAVKSSYSNFEEKARKLELTDFILKETEKSILELQTRNRAPLNNLSTNNMQSFNPEVAEFVPKLFLNPEAQDFRPIR